MLTNACDTLEVQGQFPCFYWSLTRLLSHTKLNAYQEARVAAKSITLVIIK